MKHVKIYGTLGPSCKDPETLKQMFLNGMNGIRLNLSHSTLEEAAELIENCHNAARECRITPELLIDMQGPEIRIGRLTDSVRLSAGDVIGMDTIPFPEEVKIILSGHASEQAEQADKGPGQETPDDKTPGQEVLLDDGKILLKTENTKSGQGVQLRVLRGGILESRKSVALPGRRIHAPAMTEFDREQIRNAGMYGVTAVMQPFVRSREDLIEVRNALKEAGSGDIQLFAKIENMDGINMLEELIPHCDEIVIARGDLGNAMELWELPAAQKRISAACREAGRDFMVVTQMLDSMIHRQVPTRAEVSDIFNAVLDGAASVMVTAETATGDNPVHAIRYLSKTVREAELFREIEA